MKTLSWLLLATLGLSSCAKPEPPRVTPKAVQLGAVGAQGVRVSVELDVYNPNSFALSAKSVEGALMLGNGVELGRGQTIPTSPIPGQSTVPMTSSLDIPWTNLGALLPLVTSNQPVPYRFVGSAQLFGESLNVRIPFELTGELTRNQLISLGLPH